jgi:GMP synthase - Glutamine amidotransferase domain
MNRKKVLILGPGGQYNHLIYRKISELGHESYLQDFNSDFSINFDAFIIGGGPARLSKNSYEVKRIRELVYQSSKPILGICLGFQILSLIYGGELTSSKPSFGPQKIFIEKYDALLNNIPNSFVAWESHNDTLTKLPEDFEVLAYSKLNATKIVEIIKHKSKLIYGVQFHPEVDHTEFGKEILNNFVNLNE